jgi:hypothetical protein
MSRQPGQGDKMMYTKSKIALAVAIVLGTASVSVSAPKHPVHPLHQRHQAVVKQHVPPHAYAYQRFGHVRVPEPAYMEYQTWTEWEGNGGG